MNSRRGFALITVLAVMTIASAIALAAAGVARDAFNAERNRIQLERAGMRASGCVARTRAVIDATMTAGGNDAGAQLLVWRNLDKAVAASELLALGSCNIELEAAGTRLDVNTAPPDVLERLLSGLDDPDAAAHAQAIRGSLVRAPIDDDRAMARIDGLRDTARTLRLLSATEGKVDVLRAPREVLVALPGVSTAIVDRLVSIRDQGMPINNLVQLAAGASDADAGEFYEHYDEISRMATIDPDAWMLRASAPDRDGSNRVTIEVRLVRSGSHASVVRTRVIE